MGFFKVQHMGWRVAAPPHAYQKFHLSETELFKQVCRMLPTYDRRPERLHYVFTSANVRSTLDDRLLAKASDVREVALEVQENLLQKVKELHESGNPATREELLNAMLHLFLSAGVDEEEVGNLSLDKMPNSQLFRYGLGEAGPVPIYTSKDQIYCSHPEPRELRQRKEEDGTFHVLGLHRVRLQRRLKRSSDQEHRSEQVAPLHVVRSNECDTGRERLPLCERVADDPEQLW